MKFEKKIIIIIIIKSRNNDERNALVNYNFSFANEGKILNTFFTSDMPKIV